MPTAHRSRRLRAATGSVVTALAVLALAAGPAAAASCPAAPASKPFMPWVDPADYVLAPGGNLEAPGDWTLSGGAAVVDGNEPFQVGAPSDDSSLHVPAGGSAATAPMCVGLEHPTLRLFAKRESGSLLGTLKVEALFTGAAGDVHAWPMGSVVSYGSWAPTLPLPIVVNSLALVQSTPQVAFRFTPQGGSRWSIDDVYVDPYRTN